MDRGSPASSQDAKQEAGEKDKEKAKRGYRACLHCRSRKARCDLGRIDAPSSPPCSRCRRESRECVFAPSRRGGNNNRRKAESLGLDLGTIDERAVASGSKDGSGEYSGTGNGAGGQSSQYESLETHYHPTQRHSFTAVHTQATLDRPGPHAVQDAFGNDTARGGAGAGTGGGQVMITAHGVRISPNASAPSVLPSAVAHAHQAPSSDPHRNRSQGHGPIPLSDVEADNFDGHTGPHTRPRPYGSSLKDLLHTSSPQHNPYSGTSNGAISSLDPSPAAATTTASPSTSTNHPTPRWSVPVEMAAGRSGNGRKGLERREGSTSPKRRRMHLNPPLHADDPSSLVVADVQNESDALHILALASGSGARDRHHGGETGERDAGKRTGGSPMDADPNTDPAVGSTRRTGGNVERSDEAPLDLLHRKGPVPALLARQEADEDGSGRSRSQSKAPVSARMRNKSISRELKDYELVRKGIVGEELACKLVDIFFRCHHHLFPMVPASLIPRGQEEIGVFANNEQYLMTAIIIIASRNDTSIGNVHDDAWALFRAWISDLAFLGGQPTVGLVEALLLLAENLPRDPTKDSESSHVHGAENRQAWMLIGCAIRNAYGLGIDKIASKFVPEKERTFELERARLAWTYCYLFDRHVSLRLGLAFWSRGPSVCFQGFSDSAQTGPAAAAANFPYLVENSQGPEREKQEDMAGLVQAYLELTQIMTNAHDVLYPNPARTRSLVMYGEYFKYIDELVRSLEGFKIMWQHKKWTVFPLNDVLWAMYFYTQLYLCGFSFQAHVERAAMRAEEEYSALNEKHKAEGGTGDLPRPPLSLFPRGAAASPDCRYIFQSCDAARTLLHICTDSLGPGGALPFLPSRYLLWFTYAAIVLLKALYSGAMLRADHAETLSLIDQLCVCLAGASTDDEHPAVRYGRQLEALRRKLASSTSSDSQAPGSPVGIAGVATVAPDVPAAIAKPPMPASKKVKMGTKSARTPIPLPAPGGSVSSQRREPGHMATGSPVWTMPAVPDQTDGVSFPYPVTPNNHTADSVKVEPLAQPPASSHSHGHSLSNFAMTSTVPRGPNGQYGSYGHSEMQSQPQQHMNGISYLSNPGMDGLQQNFPPQSSNSTIIPSGMSFIASSSLPGGSESIASHTGHINADFSNPFGVPFNQYQNTGLPQPTQYAQQQPSQTAAAMGADFEVNNLGFPQLLDDWFGPTQEEDDALEPLDLQDFWMKVGPGEGGFPFR